MPWIWGLKAGLPPATAGIRQKLYSCSTTSTRETEITTQTRASYLTQRTRKQYVPGNVHNYVESLSLAHTKFLGRAYFQGFSQARLARAWKRKKRQKPRTRLAQFALKNVDYWLRQTSRLPGVGVRVGVGRGWLGQGNRQKRKQWNSPVFFHANHSFLQSSKQPFRKGPTMNTGKRKHKPRYDIEALTCRRAP